ncbi:unnamed protein product [Closterium sp. NIES-54]
MGAAASTELADAIGAAPGGMGASHALRKGGNARASAKVQPVWDEGEDEAIERKARQLEQLKDRVNAAIASGSRVKQLLEDEVRRDLGLSAIRLRFTANGALEHCSLFSEPGGRHGCNQDSMIAWEDFNVPEIAGRTRGRMPPGAASDVIFCAVFDGHGPNGHLVSQRVRDSLPSRIASLLAPPPVATVSPYGHLDKSAPPMAPASDQLLQRLGVNGGSSKSKGASGKVHPLGLAPGYGGGGDGGIGGFGKTLHRSRSANSLDNSAPRGSVSPYHSSSSSASSASAAAAAAAAEASKEASKAQVERAFRRAFLEMDDELRSHPHVDGHVSGSTAVVAALLGRRLVVASIGDSRAVLAYRCKAGHAAPGTAPAINGMQCKPLTNDHKCSVASERKRIEQAGGRVQASEHEPWTPRIWLPRERSPGLVPSRAFGDFVVKDYGVIAEPDILIRHLTSEDEFIILASDGLWDVMTPQEAMSAVLAAPTRQTAARHLISHARSLWAAKHQSVRPDDCTAVVLFLPEFAPSGLLSGSALPHSGPLSSTPLSGPLSSSTPYSGPLSPSPPLVLYELGEYSCLQDAMVTTTTPGGQRVSICTCIRMGPHLATFTRRLGSSLYMLATEPPQVAASAQVPASGQVAASCSCRLLSHQTLLWHHRLGHPSLPRLRCMHSRLLVSGLPRSLPPLPPSPAPPCLPCVEGRQRATPHSSSFPPTTAPLQTLHMDVWGPARVSGQGRERYFMLVVDDYTRYTTVFPLRGKGEVSTVLIPWIRTVHLQLRERFDQDLRVLRLHSDRGGEFSSDLLRDFCRGEGILQSFTLSDSPQQNGIDECRIGLVMEVARTSMIHAAAPHFLWLFAGSCAFVRDTSTDKLSTRAIPCVFLGFVPDAPGWKFYHPTSRRVLPSQDVTFNESVPFYHLFPYLSALPPPPLLFLAPGPPLVDPLPPQGPAPSDVSQVDPLPGTARVEVAVDSGAARGAASGGAVSGGAASGCAGPGMRGLGLLSLRVLSLGVLSRRVWSLGQLREWLVRLAHCRSGAPTARETGDTGAGGAAVTTGAGGTGGTAATSHGGARTSGDGAAGTGGIGCAGAGDPTEPGAAGAGGARAGGAGVGGLGAEGAGAPASPLPAPSPYTKQSGGLTEHRELASRPVSPVRTACRAPCSRPPPVPGTHAMALRPSSVPLRVPLPAPLESSIPEVLDPASDRARAASPTAARLLATAVIDSSFESAVASALVAELLDFAAACRLDYASALVAESVPASPPSVGGECALGTDILEDRQEDFECLAAAVPRFASMLLAPEGDPDAPDIPTPRSYAEAIMGPYFSQWHAAMYAEMASWKSTGTYVDAVPPSRANIVDGMWIFRVKRPPGSPPAFKARYIARGFSTQWSFRRPVYGLRQAPREWHNKLRTTLAALGFAPSTADPSLLLRTDTSMLPFYVLVYVDDLVFATADTEALSLVNSELQKRHTCTDLGELRSYLGLQITRDRARRTITRTQSQMVHQVLQRFCFQFSSPQPTPLSTSHSLSAPPSDESVEPSGPCPELVGCLMYLMTCTRPDLAYPLSLLARYVAPGRHRKVHWDAAKRVLRYLCSTSGMGLVLGGRGPVVLTGHADASWVDDSATQRTSQGYTFSLGSGSVSWRSTRSSSVLSSSCEAEIYGGALAAQELRWLTYLLTDLGEQPRSPLVLYVDNKVVIALCQEHRLEHRTKHIALRYFLARELQQRGQLRLAYVATQANTADVFTKALPLGDNQRFAIVLGLVPTLPHLLTAWLCLYCDLYIYLHACTC